MRHEQMRSWLNKFVTVGFEDGSRWQGTLVATSHDGEYLMKPAGVTTYEALPNIRAEEIIFIQAVDELPEEPEEALPE